MCRQSSELSDALGRRLKKLDATRRRVESLCVHGHLSRGALEHVYEGLFLNAHRAFEGFIEDLFIGLLVENGGCCSVRGDIQPRLSVRSHAVARDLVLGPRARYVDWLPYERTLELAELFFRGGRPFSGLSEEHRQQLKRCVVLRNAIAHTSRYSQDQFQKVVLQNARLPPGHRSPAAYLRDVFATGPNQTRYELLASQLLAAARDLAR